MNTSEYNGVSIIIVNYNTFTLTQQCIESIYKFSEGFDYEIILVDNQSPQRDIEEIKSLFPDVLFIQNSENNGFAKGNNLGIKHAKYNHILLLNSDCLFIENSTKKVLDFSKSLPKYGAIGIKLIYPDGQIQYAPRRFRTIQWELLDLFRPMVWLLPKEKQEKLMLGRYSKNENTLEVDMIPGAYFFFKKNILDLLPQKKLDDTLFMYGEDYFWCYQFQKLGFPNYFYADTEIIHFLSASTDAKKRINLVKTMVKNNMINIKKMHSNPLYIFTYAFIYKSKEYGRMYIKLLMQKLGISIPR